MRAGREVARAAVAARALSVAAGAGFETVAFAFAADFAPVATFATDFAADFGADFGVAVLLAVLATERDAAALGADLDADFGEVVPPVLAAALEAVDFAPFAAVVLVLFGELFPELFGAGAFFTADAFFTVERAGGGPLFRTEIFGSEVTAVSLLVEPLEVLAAPGLRLPAAFISRAAAPATFLDALVSSPAFDVFEAVWLVPDLAFAMWAHSLDFLRLYCSGGLCVNLSRPVSWGS